MTIAPMKRTKRALSSPRLQATINVFVIITLAIGLFASLLGIENQRHQSSYITCVARYNDAYQRYQAARAHLNGEQIDVTNTVILKVATATTEQQVAKALSDFTLDQQEIAKEKAEHPVPAPPSEVCE